MKTEEALAVTRMGRAAGRTQKNGKCTLFLIRLELFVQFYSLKARDLHGKGNRGRKF